MTAVRALVLSAALVTLPAQAATTFYWGMEANSTTLGSDDKSASDTTATGAGGVSFSGTAAKVGSFGLLTTNQQDYYIFSSTSLCSLTEGTAAGWFNMRTAIASPNGTQMLWRCMDTVGSSSIDMTIGSTDELRISITNNSGGTISLATSACNLAADTWYFFKVSWHIANDDRKVECYNSSGSLIDSASDTSTDLASNAPSAFTDLRWGNSSANTNVTWTDNVFLSDTYDTPFENFKSITSYIPAYSSGPSNGSFTSTTLPFTYTPNQNGTTYAAACTNGQTITTFANLQSGTCSGGAAVGTGTDTSTAAVSDTVTITGLSSGTTYDVYIGHESTIGGQSTISSLADRATTGAGPTFDTSPSVTSQTTSQYTVTYDTASATNFFLAALKKDSATCTCNNIESNSCTGGVAYATEAATNSSDTLSISISGGDPFPVYDLQACAEDGSSNDTNVVEMGDELLDVPSGRQYVVKSGAPGGAEVGLFDGASPAAADGDYMDVSLQSDSFALGAAAHDITVHADTTFIISAAGDTSRQLLTRRFYDVSLAAWSDSSAVELAINDLPPSYVNPDPLLYERNATCSAPLDSLWDDPEGDAITHTITNNPSGSTGISGGETLDCSYDTFGYYGTVVLRAIDPYGELTDETVTIIVGVVLPDVVSWLLDETLWKTANIFAANDEVYLRRAVGQ